MRQWLRTYMFASDPAATRKAGAIARWFGDYSKHKSHALAISRDQARARGVVIDDLEADSTLQDAVLSVHHAALITFFTPSYEIVENHLGQAWVMRGVT